MKALFLAGGMGTRLRPLTDKVPKPIVPIMTKPLLERNMLNLKRNGINEIVLSTCYKSYQIEKYFHSGKNLGLKIEYVQEDIPLGTGGAVKNAEKFFNDTFVVFNSDILTDINIKDLVDFHKHKHSIATIAAVQVENPSAYGVIEYDNSKYITLFKEKPKFNEIKSNFINAGIYVFEPDIFKEIPKNKVVSIEKETFPLLLRKNYKISMYTGSSYWIDIGSPKKYVQANMDIMAGKCKIQENDFSKQKIYTGYGCEINPNVQIIAPTYIGNNAKILPFATIGPNAVIGDNCSIDIGSKISDSILWNNVSVGSDAKVRNTIITSNNQINKNMICKNAIYTNDINKSA